MKKLIYKKQKEASYRGRLNRENISLKCKSPAIEMLIPNPESLVHWASGFIFSGGEMEYLGLSHRDYDPMFYFKPNEYYEHDEPPAADFDLKETPTLSNGIFIPGTKSFGHFIFEILPRLYVCEFLRDKNYPIFISNKTPTRFISIIKNFSERAVITVPHAPFYSIGDDVLIPCCPIRRDESKNLMIDVNSWNYIKWRASIVIPESDSGLKKIYMPRGVDISWRNLIDEDRLINRLMSSGFGALSPKAVSIEEQINIAREATHMLGAVGSQMLLATFLSPEAKLAIAYPPGLDLNYQMYIPLISGVECFTLNAIPASRPSSQFKFLNSDLTIPESEIDALLSKWRM